MAIFPKRQRIAVVEIFGTIGGRVKSPVFERVFNEVRKSKRVKAVVLDIDSPGGAVPASDYLYRSVERLAREKPVVASIRGTGASGAYLICCAAQKIVATPGSIVGSIGVISIRPVLQTTPPASGSQRRCQQERGLQGHGRLLARGDV
jgi:protease-4